MHVFIMLLSLSGCQRNCWSVVNHRCGRRLYQKFLKFNTSLFGCHLHQNETEKLSGRLIESHRLADLQITYWNKRISYFKIIKKHFQSASLLINVLFMHTNSFSYVLQHCWNCLFFKHSWFYLNLLIKLPPLEQTISVGKSFLMSMSPKIKNYLLTMSCVWYACLWLF